MTECSSDWAYSIAYNAGLRAGRALMAHLGFRPTSGEGAHVAVVRFLESVLGDCFPNEVAMMETMRRKRHRAVYEDVGIVGEDEARAAQVTARTLCDAVDEVVSGGRQLDLAL
jgi:hypothetical protein